MMNNILLYEPDQERVSHLLFLLNLADLHGTVARTIEEAYNWLSADRQKVIKFDLFLLGSLQEDELEKKLLPEMSDLITVPIIYIKQEATNLPEFLSDKTINCHPVNLLSCLHECLGAEKKNSHPVLQQ